MIVIIIDRLCGYKKSNNRRMLLTFNISFSFSLRSNDDNLNVSEKGQDQIKKNFSYRLVGLNESHNHDRLLHHVQI